MRARSLWSTALMLALVGIQYIMLLEQEELMEICYGSRDGAATMSNKDANAKAVGIVKSRNGLGMLRLKRLILAAEMAMCVDSPSKRGKENALDQGEDVNYSDAAKQDELMETCNAAEMVLLLWVRMIPRARARLQKGVAGSRNAALRAERLILSFPYLGTISC